MTKHCPSGNIEISLKNMKCLIAQMILFHFITVEIENLKDTV